MSGCPVLRSRTTTPYYGQTRRILALGRVTPCLKRSAVFVLPPRCPLQEKKHIVQNLIDRIESLPIKDRSVPETSDPYTLGYELKMRLASHAPVFTETYISGGRAVYTLVPSTHRYVSIWDITKEQDPDLLCQVRVRLERHRHVNHKGNRGDGSPCAVHRLQFPGTIDRRQRTQSISQQCTPVQSPLIPKFLSDIQCKSRATGGRIQKSKEISIIDRACITPNGRTLECSLRKRGVNGKRKRAFN